MIRVISLPLFDQVAASLRRSGQYQTELTADDVTSIMHAVAASLLADQRIVSARIERLENRIVDAEGTNSAVIAVSRPLTATIEATFTFVNDTAQDRIRLKSDTIRSRARFPARLLLQTLDLEGRVRRALADPERALQLVLARQLEPHGVTVTDVGLHFGTSTLSVDLRGGAVPPVQ